MKLYVVSTSSLNEIPVAGMRVESLNKKLTTYPFDFMYIELSFVDFTQILFEFDSRWESGEKTDRGDSRE